MKAVVGYTDKTVDQVRNEIDAREAAAKNTRKGGKRSAAPAVGAPITSVHTNALAELQAAADRAKAEARGT